jgi:uncharacterized protein YndB with AHSA1/START domain
METIELKLALKESMMSCTEPSFVYVTFIETTAEKLWHALIDGDFTERYWFGYRVTSDWKPGSSYRFARHDGQSVEGKVLTFDPPRRLAYSWDSCAPDIKERPSRVTFDIEPLGNAVKLTVVHDDFEEGSPTLRNISGGWPRVLSSLKTLLETGHMLKLEPPVTARKENANAQA